MVSLKPFDFIDSLEEETWRLKAACRGEDPYDFVPPFGDGKGAGGIQASDSTKKRINRAKAICDECKVRRECAAYADRTGTVDGVWGGEYKIQFRRRNNNYRKSKNEQLALEMEEVI